MLHTRGTEYNSDAEDTVLFCRTKRNLNKEYSKIEYPKEYPLFNINTSKQYRDPRWAGK